MAFSYDETNLGTDTPSGRLNAVRLLIGDTDITDVQTKDSEILFALAQNGNNVYSTASWMARVLSAKFSRLVDVELDGQISESYSQLQKHYGDLASELEYQAKSLSGSLGFAAGGVSKARMETVEDNTDRPGSLIRRDQFSFLDTDYTGEY
jgi:hypothetical protein